MPFQWVVRRVHLAKQVIRLSLSTPRRSGLYGTTDLIIILLVMITGSSPGFMVQYFWHTQLKRHMSSSKESHLLFMRREINVQFKVKLNYGADMADNLTALTPLTI